MKRKIIMSCILMVLFTVLSLFVSYNIHWMLMRKREMCSVNPAVLISGLHEPKIRAFFFICLMAFALLIVYMLVFQSYLKYKSDMQFITPDIQTPKAEGQGQYGMARWLDKKKYRKVFACIQVDDKSETIMRLLAHGKDDMKEESNDEPVGNDEGRTDVGNEQRR